MSWSFVYETDLAFPLPYSSSSGFHCFFLGLYFCRNCSTTVLFCQSDTTIPILRQQGYKLIRYTGTMTRHFLLVCIVYFCWKKQARLFLVLSDLLIIRRDVTAYMQIAITLRQGEIRTFIFYLSEMKEPNWCFWAGNLLILFTQKNKIERQRKNNSEDEQQTKALISPFNVIV